MHIRASQVVNPKRTPRISVVMLSYNFEKYLRQCIESVLAQTLAPFEIIICDDHSTDNSWNIIKEYQKLFPELLHCHRHKKNIGMTKNLIYAFNAARGELVTHIDGDDRWLSGKLEKEWVALQKNPTARIAYSNVYMIDDQGERTGIWFDGTGHVPPSGDIFSKIWSWSCFPDPGYVYRNELMYRSDYQELNYAEDIDLFLDLDFQIRATAGRQVVYSGEALVEWRVHSGGVHNKPLEYVFKDMLLVYLKNLPLIANRSKKDIKEIRQGIIERMFGIVAPIQTASVERLQLIERLDAECKQILHAAEKRLTVIHRLEEEIVKLRSQNTDQQRISDEMLAAINELKRVTDAKKDGN
ncbi:MAG: glycosyltransferase [Bacteroidota bacterium]